MVNKLIYACLCPLLVSYFLSGCSNTDEPFESDGTQAYISFSTSIYKEVSATRAVDDKWDKDNDEVGIFMTKSDYSQYSTYAHFGNKLHKPSQSGSSPCELKPVDEPNQLYYPTNGDKVGFVGYYPYKSGSTLASPYAVKIETPQTVDNMKKFDLLWGKTTTDFDKKSTKNPSLTFVHQLSKIVVEVTLSSPEMTGGSVQKVEMTGIPTEANFYLSNAELKDHKTPASVQLHQVTANKSYLGIIIPHTSGTAFKLRTLAFSITDPTGAKVTLPHPIADMHEFKPDNVYTYKVTLTRKEVKFNGCTVSDWGTKNPDENVTLGN